MFRNYQFKRKVNFDIKTYRSLVEWEQFGKETIGTIKQENCVEELKLWTKAAYVS